MVETHAATGFWCLFSLFGRLTEKTQRANKGNIKPQVLSSYAGYAVASLPLHLCLQAGEQSLEGDGPLLCVIPLPKGVQHLEEAPRPRKQEQF